MARIYTQDDRLIDVLDFLDTQANPCQEAKDFCRLLGDITMGEFLAVIKDNDAFAPNWVAYSVLSFPKLMNNFLMAGFNREMNRNPQTIAMVTIARSRNKQSMELEDNG